MSPQVTPDLSAGRTWRVRASAFRDPVGDAERVAAALGIELASAQQLVASAPVLIGEGSTRAEAEQIAASLRGLGARVRIEDASQDVLPSSDPPPGSRSGPPSAPPPRPSPYPPSALDRALEDAPSRSFWVEVPIAFLAPLLGRGWLAILGCGAVGSAMLLAINIPGLIVPVAAFLGLLFVGTGTIAELFTRLAQAAMAREPGRLPEPNVAIPDATTLALRGLVTVLVLLALGTLVVAAAYWLLAAGAPPIVLLPLAFAPYFYWPMGLTVQAVSGRLTGVIDFVAVVRGIAAAPLEYLAVVVASFLLLVGMTLALAGAALGGTLAATALEAPTLVVYVVAFAYLAALAYIHGVLGYLMGALVASKEDRFDFLVG
ncbi:MAG: ribosomal protein L7/L12 [Sandaracinaceae bacterium]|nr:ribosomal protein L7/L12 [Sandaracinaceae bacterium]